MAGVSGAMRRADGANGHGGKDNAKEEMFHRGVPDERDAIFGWGGEILRLDGWAKEITRIDLADKGRSLEKKETE